MVRLGGCGQVWVHLGGLVRCMWYEFQPKSCLQITGNSVGWPMGALRLLQPAGGVLFVCVGN